MDVELLSRLQFALTIMFHYIYPPLSIGLGLQMVIMEAIYLLKGDPIWLQLAQFWTRIFAVTFAIGVATGIVMEFEFGTNWAAYSRYVGDVFGSALAAEGIFAFFLESGFLALLLFGWNRISPRLHFFATLMVCLGAHFSAVWIVVANSWMQTPSGFHIVGEGISARAEIVDFWAMVFNPSSVDRLVHVILGAWLAGAFLVISVSAFYKLQGRHLEFARKGLRLALLLASVSVLLQALSGDSSGKVVANHQPIKLAALEGLYPTEKGAPLTLFGIPNPAQERIDYQIAIPNLLSFLAYGDFHAPVKGLSSVPAKDRPNVWITFVSYRLMLAMWTLMVLTCGWGLLRWKQGTLEASPWLLRLMVVSVLFPQVANQMGWVAAETGRYPWIVYDLLRISQGLSESVTSQQVLTSIIMFTIVYLFLFAMFLYLLTHKIHQGPPSAGDKEKVTPYHQLQEYAEEVSHGTAH